MNGQGTTKPQRGKQTLSRPHVRPTPSWLSGLSLLCVGLPSLLALFALHERVAGAPPGVIASWLYGGIALLAAAIGRFVVHLLWDALELGARRR